MKKRILSLVLTAVLMCGVFSSAVFARGYGVELFLDVPCYEYADEYYFTPPEDGWYSIYLFDKSGYPIDSEPGFLSWYYNDSHEYHIFSKQGVHLYLRAGEHYRCYYAHENPISKNCLFLFNQFIGSGLIKQSSFPAISEAYPAVLPLGAADGGIDGGGEAFNYVTFIPSESGTYEFDFSNDGTTFSWGIKYDLRDEHGAYISFNTSDDYRSYKMSANLTAGKTYYVGVSSDHGGSTTVSVKALSTQPKACQTHKYTSASGDVCTVCGHVFDYALVEYDKTLYAAANNIAVRDKPYAKAGKLVKKLAKGTKVNVKYYFNNSLGSKWYITEDGNYIYSERLTSKSPNEITLRFDANAPTFSNKPIRQKSTTGTFRIPTDSIPERNGYKFMGWSTSKNATSATYNPGSSFCTNKDTTLYAVWIKVEGVDELIKYALSFRGMTYSECENNGLKMPRLAGWCNYFVYTCAKNVGLSDIIPSGGVEEMYRKILAAGGKSVTDPQPGDIIFFNWNAGAHFNDKNGWSHVGIVYEVADGRISVVHGNWHYSHSGNDVSKTVVCTAQGCGVFNCSKNNAVTWEVHDSQICAYARPNYERIGR